MWSCRPEGWKRWKRGDCPPSAREIPRCRGGEITRCVCVVSKEKKETPGSAFGCKSGCWPHNSLTISYFRGERGIRTPGTVARTPHFECGPIDHSGISPNFPDSGFPCPLRLRLCTARRPENLRFGTANIDKIFIFAHPAAKKTLLNPKKVHIAAPNGRSVPNYAYLCSEDPMQYFPRTPVYRAKTILKSVRFSFY